MFKMLLPKKFIISIFTIITFFISTNPSSAQSFSQNGGQVNMTGDTVEYSHDGQKMIAKGHVVIKHNGATLLAEKVEFDRQKKIARAWGNARLTTETGELRGEELEYNFETMKGEFNNAKIMTAPLYGTGKKVKKVDDNHIKIERSTITTCDLDKPHFHLLSQKVDIYPGDHLRARHTRLMLGNIPLLYIPRFTHDLSEGEPFIIFTPGYEKEFGAFLYSTARFRINENVNARLRVDWRERKDVAEGLDVDYRTDNFGSGVLRTYYMNERSLQVKRLIDERTLPTIERERFKIEWRHKWDVDEDTTAIWQYYKLSDKDLLKDYFEREFDEDTNPDTFFVLTRTLDQGAISFRTDVRVNRFESLVERLPEVQYDLPSYKLGDTNLYFKNQTIYSNLVKKEPSPNDVNLETMRIHTDNELSYPMKVGIVEFKPFVGGKNTYYTRAKNRDDYDSIRGLFRTGATLSTKFYKLMDVSTNAFGLDINRLRHIISPSVNYEYNHRPTIDSSKLDQFDGIDSLDQKHLLIFALENKLQTKRNNQTVELLRFILESDFRLKEDPDGGGFDDIRADMDFRPTDWLTLYFDATYGTREEHLKTANFDLYVNNDDKWRLGLGKRFEKEVDDQLTADFYYKVNPKWSFNTYTRFDLDRGDLKEQDYVLSRDMHEWIMDINFNQTRGQGSEVLIIFTLKAFPELAVDFGSSFNKRKSGSQSAD